MKKRALQRTRGPPVFKDCQSLRHGPGRCWRIQRILCLRGKKPTKERESIQTRDIIINGAMFLRRWSLVPGKERKGMEVGEE